MLFVSEPPLSGTDPRVPSSNISSAASTAASAIEAAASSTADQTATGLDGLDLVPNTKPGAKAGELVCDSGLSPPTQHIVRRRFNKAQKYISKFTTEEIAEAERVLMALMTPENDYEHVVAELVDAEDWMAPCFQNGGDHFTLLYEDGILNDMYQMQHPTSHGSLWGLAAKKDSVPVVVHPNPDGTFGAVATSGVPSAAPSRHPKRQPTAALATDIVEEPLYVFDEPLYENILLPGIDDYEDEGADDLDFSLMPDLGASTVDGAGQQADADDHEWDTLPVAGAGEPGDIVMQGTSADESWPAEAEFPASALPDDDSNVAQDVPEPEEVDPRAEPILKRIADLKASIADVETKAATQTLKPLKLRFEATLGTLRQELKAAEQELENLNT
jgi:hypothetical protein